MDLKSIQQRIRTFRDERDWMQFHNPKNLAMSISIEAGELLEHFQWKNCEESETHAIEAKDQIADEVADNGNPEVVVADAGVASFLGTVNVTGASGYAIFCNSVTAVTRFAIAAAGGAANTNCTN